jgi:hypothetical protein
MNTCSQVVMYNSEVYCRARVFSRGQPWNLDFQLRRVPATKPLIKDHAKTVCLSLLQVAYAIALIYEIVWVVESQSGLPVASVLLMVCYCVVIAATVTLVHGLITVSQINTNQKTKINQKAFIIMATRPGLARVQC